MKEKKIITKKKRYWSADITRNSHALQLESGVFTLNNPKEIALSLRKSALTSRNRKGTPFQSAMSMLNFYINRGGKNLSNDRRKILNEAKIELRKVFHKKSE